MYGTDSETIKVQRVQRMLAECEALRGKPKIILVLACRGHDRDAAEEIPHPPGFVAAGPEPAAPAVVTKHSDVLLVQSSAPGTVSWATEQGTYFVQAIAACLHRYGGSKPPQKHFEDVLTLAGGLMMEGMSSREWPDPRTKLLVKVMSTPHRTSSLSGAIRLHKVMKLSGLMLLTSRLALHCCVIAARGARSPTTPTTTTTSGRLGGSHC